MKTTTSCIQLLALHAAQSQASHTSLQTAFIPQHRQFSYGDSQTRNVNNVMYVGNNSLRRHQVFIQLTGGSNDTPDTLLDTASAKAKRKSQSKRAAKKKNLQANFLSKEDKKATYDDASSDTVHVSLENASLPAVPVMKGGESYKQKLIRAKETLLAQRKASEAHKQSHLLKSRRLSFDSISKAASAQQRHNSIVPSPSWPSTPATNIVANKEATQKSSDALTIMEKINLKIQQNNFSSRTGQKPLLNIENNNPYESGPNVHTQHATDSMQSLLGYNQFTGEWNERNATTYHVAVVFGKTLIQDQVTVEYATRIRTLVKLLKEEPNFRPKLICFTGGVTSDGNTISDASAGYVYFRHLCATQNVTFDSKVWVDSRSSNEREAVERIASELWRNHIKQWLSERPLVERTNQHYGVGWKILERKVDIHFTLVSTEYHLCNLNDVHHRSPLKSFLQPLVSLRGLAGSDRWENNQELSVMDPNYSTSVHVKGSNKAPVVSERATFGGIENSVDTSWSFQYGTYPFLHGHDEAIVFLGQCYLLGEELTPLLVNMKGVVEQVRL